MSLGDKLQIAGIIFCVGLAFGVMATKKISSVKHQKCVITIDQIQNELSNLPPDVTSATISMGFIKQNGNWVNFK